ncbi:helix-turn-helix transcriptional regulator, putative [Syntrophotalea carbinolica DSM 2380]|uniref:Helix-turn-helix transcriptional regulator, putative n=1 Tax=Syntrophotalea carbinolica (strain DSM 2380 / NBRC 103641 / GraBd1) TaxID=338963 RepID=Q3A589_SYNC1|nr:transcriptional regulator [Syntrophotalea carbinolica]ABA88468.1 helix-turn-helix transcriptional regulator, putative [Syntrophotalea carbinolica DSM 2380]
MAGHQPGRPGRPPRKYSQAARLHDLIRILEVRHGSTADELAEECGVTRRTIYRDLQAIEDAGYPLIKEPSGDGRILYGFLTGFSKIPPITFSLSELMTLYLCRGQLGMLEGTPFLDDLDAVFGRIRASLPPRSVAHLERLAQAVTPRFQGTRDYRGKREVLESLRRALLYQYRCTIRYAPARRKAAEYLCDPYTLLFFKESLYVVGYAHNRGDLRRFLVDRIESVRVGEERFEIPEDFRLDEEDREAFGMVGEKPQPIRVRFFSEVSHLIRERQWHPTQQLEEQPDGSLILSLQAGGHKEILAWLYSFLPHLEVLGPDTLRHAFAAGLQQALDATL